MLFFRKALDPYANIKSIFKNSIEESLDYILDYLNVVFQLTWGEMKLFHPIVQEALFFIIQKRSIEEMVKILKVKPITALAIWVSWAQVILDLHTINGLPTDKILQAIDGVDFHLSTVFKKEYQVLVKNKKDIFLHSPDAKYYKAEYYRTSNLLYKPIKDNTVYNLEYFSLGDILKRYYDRNYNTETPI